MEENPFKNQSDEYLMTILNQCHNFSDYHIKYASEEALKRSLIADDQLKILLMEGLRKREEKRQKNHANLINSMMHEPESETASRKYSFLVPLLFLAIAAVVYFLTGWLIIIFFGAAGAGLAAKRPNLFNRRY